MIVVVKMGTISRDYLGNRAIFRDYLGYRAIFRDYFGNMAISGIISEICNFHYGNFQPFGNKQSKFSKVSRVVFPIFVRKALE